MKQRLIIQTNCIICNNPLSDYTQQKQDHEGKKISNLTCSSGCRTIYYRNIKDKNIIDESILKNDFTYLLNYKLKRIKDLGFKIRIEKAA